LYPASAHFHWAIIGIATVRFAFAICSRYVLGSTRHSGAVASICSSNREWNTTAAAPACSISRTFSSFSESGEAEGTKGERKESPRYLVVKSIASASGLGVKNYCAFYPAQFSQTAGRIWSPIRSHPFFNTIEFRICDAQSRVEDTIALAALMQAIVAKLHKLRRQYVTFRSYPRRLIDENRWRASRYGLDGKLIDFGRKCEMDERELLHEMLEFIATEVDELGSQSEVAHIERIITEGTGADRQLAVWERTHDMKAVVDHIVAETYEGLGETQASAA